jgi:HprK-related kinase A
LTVASLSPRDIYSRVKDGDGIRFRTGPFSVRLTTTLPECIDPWRHAYGALHILEDDEPSHFRVHVCHGHGARRWIARQSHFVCDGQVPFEPYPASHAFPLFEWGLNWCIAHMAQYFLLLHSAVVEKNGHAAILPAAPGSGKSTLCAGLVARGWRLLSDEFGILRHDDGMLLPMPRPVPLKNASIDVMQKFAPHLSFGPRYEKTRKGTVVHLFPPEDSLRRQAEPARPRWVIFPRFQQGAPLCLTPQPETLAIARLVNNAFNYPVTGEDGFRSLCRLVRDVDAFDLVNGDLNEAVECIDGLAAAEAA